jgi:inosose dehydratase
MRVAVTATIWGETPFREVSDQAREGGYAGIEGVGELVGNAVLARKVIADAGLDVSGGRFFANWFSDLYQEIELDQLRRAAEFLAEIGAECVITSSRPVPERIETAGHVVGERQDGLVDSQWIHLADTLAKAVHICDREFDLPLFFRNQLGSYVETVDELEQLMSLTDPATLRLAPDIGYLFYAGVDPVPFLRENYERIGYVTLKDLDSDLHEIYLDRKASLREFWDAGGFVELGEGDVDIAGVVALLKEREFEGWVAVGHDYPGRDPAASVQIARDYLVGLGLELESGLE